MKKLRMIVNISMTVVLLCLMAYSLVGELAHEILGTAMFVLFTVHHILNRKWFGALTKGRYNAFRILQTALVFALILTVLASAVSGIVMSRYVYTFLPISGGAALARQVHLVCAYLNFILMSLHLGLHWNLMISAMGEKKERSAVRTWIARGLAFAFAGYGIYAFIKRQIGSYLFLRSQFVFFDTAEPLFFFFFDYVAIMGLFVCIGHYLAQLTKRFKPNRRKDASR
ncbi:MAG: DUF4405 domain-containing protein [Clostridia bacterium]|nr:DUF4405 domain-containing protein [Clostridia bacterium]